MFGKIAYFVIWKNNIVEVADSMLMFGGCETRRAKDERAYVMTVRLKNNEQGKFMEALMRLSKNGIDIRMPSIRTTIFGKEL